MAPRTAALLVALLWAVTASGASGQDAAPVEPSSSSNSSSATSTCLLTETDLSSLEPAVAELAQLVRQLSTTPAVQLSKPAVRQLARLMSGLRYLALLLASTEVVPVSFTSRRLRALPGAIAFERELSGAHLAAIRADLNWTAVDAPCRHAVRALLDGVDQMDDWAWEMFDSNGKPEAGFSDGNSFWEGRFSQCNGVLQHLELANGSLHIKGLYFKAQLSGIVLPEEQSFHLTVGTCFPDLCSSDDVKTILNDAPGFIGLPKVVDWSEGVTFRTDDVTRVETEKRFWQDYTAVSALATVALFATLALAGTLVDVLSEEEESRPAARGSNTPTTKGEQTKLVDERPPASYSSLNQQSAPASTAAQP